MRTTLSILALLLAANVASAQPGAQSAPPPPPQNYPPQQQPYYPPQQPPQPYGYPPQQPYAYPPQIQLSQEDRELLRQGEITDGQIIGGIALSLFVGFGTGQAAEGRWSEKGWIFSVGEGASIVAILYGVSQICYSDSYGETSSSRGCNDRQAEAGLWTGLIGFVVFRVWEVIDAIGGPADHNERVRDLRIRTGQQPNYYGMQPYVAPTRGDNGGFTTGLSWHF